MTYDDLFERYEKTLKSSLPAAPDRPLRPADRLAELGLRDSLMLIQLIVQLEEGFQVDLPEETLTSETFESVDSLWRALEPLLRRAEEE